MTAEHARTTSVKKCPIYQGRRPLPATMICNVFHRSVRCTTLPRFHLAILFCGLSRRASEMARHPSPPSALPPRLTSVSEALTLVRSASPMVLASSGPMPLLLASMVWMWLSLFEHTPAMMAAHSAPPMLLPRR